MTILKLENVEAVVIGYINSLADVTPEASTRIPNPRPASLIRVNRVGGDERNMIQERAVLLIECWGPTDTAAWATAARVHQALQGREPLEFGGVELQERSISSPVNYPDPSTTSPRYQFQLQTTVNLKGAS